MQRKNAIICSKTSLGEDASLLHYEKNWLLIIMIIAEKRNRYWQLLHYIHLSFRKWTPLQLHNLKMYSHNLFIQMCYICNLQ